MFIGPNWTYIRLILDLYDGLAHYWEIRKSVGQICREHTGHEIRQYPRELRGDGMDCIARYGASVDWTSIGPK